MPKAAAAAKKKKKEEVEESASDDDDYTWKPSWQKDEEKKAVRSAMESSTIKKRVLSSKKRGASSHPGSDADDGDGGSSSATPLRSPSASLLQTDDEKDEDDGDRDEWRTSNRHVSSKHRADPAYIAQDERWRKFREEFPVPLRQPLSAGIILGLRRQLKAKKRLVLQGIPIHLRRDVWEILSGARAFPEKLEHSNRYAFYLKHPPNATVVKQITADVGRALRGHMKFTTKTGQAELSRLLCAFAVRSPSVGYANSMCHVAAFLLLFYPEERAFWMLCTLIDIILPQDYYSQSLLGARADAQLLKILVFQRLPRVHAHLSKHGLDVSIFGLRWLMPLFLTTLPLHVCIRLFDVVMLEGSLFLLSVALALFHLHAKRILALTDAAALFEYMDRMGSDEKTLDSEAVIKEALTSKCAVGEEELKRRDTERRIMESAYLKELQASQKFKAQEEERKKREEEGRRQQVEDEEKNLSYGTEMWKVGAQGKPRKTQVYLLNETPDEKDRDKRIYTITWQSKAKQPGEARLLLRDCALHLGLAHGQFVKRADMQKMWAADARKAWSVVGAVRSLDLVCLTDFDYDEWMKVLRRVPMKSKEYANKSGKVNIRADGRTEGEEDEKTKANKPASSSALAVASSASSLGAGAAEAKKPGLSRLQQARAERAAKGEGPAANKLAALLKNGPPPPSVDVSSDDDGPPPPRKGKGK